MGLLAGVLVSAIRAPLGIDLLRIPAVGGTTEAAFRGAALLALAVTLHGSGALAGGLGRGAFFLGTATGFLVHGLVGDLLFPIEGRIGFAIVLVVLCAGIRWVGRRDGEGEGPTWKVRSGLLVAGAGATFAVESIARILGRLSLGLPQDEAVFGGVFLLSLFFGAVAFGGLFPAARGREVLVACLALGALLCAAGNQRLDGYEDLAEFGGTIASLGALAKLSLDGHVNVSHVGTWYADAALAASVFILPGLVLGAGLSAVRSGRDTAWSLAGAAVGVFAMPLVLRSMAEPQDLDSMATTSRQALLIGGGALTAAFGGALVLTGSAPGMGRLAAFLAVVVAGVGAIFVDIGDPWLFSPWNQAQRVRPIVAIDGPDGLLTVDPVQRHLVCTLDRIRVTPSRLEETGDEERLRRSVRLLGDRAAGARVLLVGELTALRAEVFEILGVRFEHTSPWWRDGAIVADALEVEESKRALVPLPEAKRRLADGSYDLVIVPPSFGPRLHSLAAQFWPAPGPAPRRGDWDIPDGTVAVIWLDAAAELSRLDLGPNLLVSLAPLEEPCVGIVLGDPPMTDELFPGPPPVFELEALATMSTRGLERKYRTRARLFRRLASGEHPVLEFLGAHYGVQVESEPLVSRDEQVEIDPDSLVHLREAALAEPPGPWLRSVVHDVARILTSKRRPDLVFEHFRPIAEAHAPWIELERIVLVAFMEFDMDEEVRPRLEDLLERSPLDVGLLIQAANWEDHVGRPEGAVRHLEGALEIQPDRSDVLRRLALITHENGLPGAAGWLERARAANPDDPELEELHLQDAAHEGPDSSP